MTSSLRTLSLYKVMLREAQKFTDFNFRNYFMRRIRDGFKENKSITDPVKIQQCHLEAQQNLVVIRRQVAIGQLFDPNQILSVEQASMK